MLASGKARPFGLAVLALCLLLQAAAPPLAARLRNAWFDGLQSLFPRQGGGQPVVVVEIDERSLTALGQWPWSRALLAQLLGKVQAAGPAVVGLAMLMPEPDRTSPDVLARSEDFPADLREGLARLPGHDRLLARAIAAGPAPVVVGVAGLAVTDMAAEPGPLPPVLLRGEAAAPVAAYGGILRSRRELDRAAAGRGLLSVERDPDGIVRRLPLLAWVGDHPFPSLAVEVARHAVGAPAIEVMAGHGGVEVVAIGGLHPPVESDGAVRLRFGPAGHVRSLSALDVLRGDADPAILRGHVVLIGVTGLGLAAREATPAEAASPAVHIHAELIEALLDGNLPHRPAWARQAEAAALLAAGLVFVLALPRLRPRHHWVLGVAWLTPPLAGVLLFQSFGLLFDATPPMLGAAAVYGAMTAALFAEAERQRQTLQSALEDHRLRMAHMGGELAAERRAAEDRLHFIDVISHEYRTPLSVLRTGLDVLEMRLQDPALTKNLSRMRRAVTRLTEVVDTGLARAHLDGARTPAEWTDTDLGGCLSEAVAACRAASPGRSVWLSLPSPAPLLKADGPMVKTAFLNLVDNALKYSDEAAPVKVALDAEAADGMCRITIADEGIGMTKAELAKVFERFYRAPAALAKPGTGMGLGIARRIIELHGGTIALASRPGEGTVVTVALPVMPAVT